MCCLQHRLDQRSRAPRGAKVKLAGLLLVVARLGAPARCESPHDLLSNPQGLPHDKVAPSLRGRAHRFDSLLANAPGSERALC